MILTFISSTCEILLISVVMVLGRIIIQVLTAVKGTGLRRIRIFDLEKKRSVSMLQCTYVIIIVLIRFVIPIILQLISYRVYLDYSKTCRSVLDHLSIGVFV